MMHSCNTSKCSSSGPVISSPHACVAFLATAKEARQAASRLWSEESRETGGCDPVKAGGCVLGKAGGHIPKCLRTLLSGRQTGGRCSLEAFRLQTKPPSRTVITACFL